MRQFDIERIQEPFELRLRIAAAMADAQRWLMSQQATYGHLSVASDRSLMDIRDLASGSWPSFWLDFRLSARHFGFASLDGETCLYAEAERVNDEPVLYDPMAWFAIIPWTVRLVRARDGGTGLRLTCPSFAVDRIQTNPWSITLRMNGALLPLLPKTRRFVTYRRDGEWVSGWSFDLSEKDAQIIARQLPAQSASGEAAPSPQPTATPSPF